MVVSFPHFGPAALAVSKFFDYLRVPYIMPDSNSSETLRLGSEISPEEICVPFKYMAGNLKAAYDAGADTAVMASTCGPCRLGEYGQLLMEVMQRAGCDYSWVLLDSPAAIGAKGFAGRFKVLLAGRRVKAIQIAVGVFLSAVLVHKMDALRAKAGARAGLLCRPYDAVKLLRKAEKDVRAAKGFRTSFNVIKAARRGLCMLEKNPAAANVRVLITGEIYTSVESEANGHLEEKLMMSGCSVTRHISVSWWLRHTIWQLIKPELPSFMKRSFGRKKGIPCNIGGYSRESVSKILRSQKFDGIIKIMPSGCMPEIVAKAFCEELGQDSKQKVLHLIYDELSGQAGYETRIEAFIDMLERRKNVLAGNGHRFNKHRLGCYR